MITLAELHHSYRSRSLGAAPVRALDGVSLEIGSGATVGVIGLNGAGKTTLLRILLGYLRPTSGVARIAGLPPRAYVERHGIGYVPERVAIPRHWTVEGALRAYAMLGNVDEDCGDGVETAIGRLGLGEVRSRKVGGLSKGNLQRLAIAQAIVCDRRLMVLDEPTDGLDPLRTAELRDLVTGWRSADPARVLIVASHDLALIERVTDRVVVLHDGRIIADLPPGDRGAGESLEATFLRLVRERAAAA